MFVMKCHAADDFANCRSSLIQEHKMNIKLQKNQKKIPQGWKHLNTLFATSLKGKVAVIPHSTTRWQSRITSVQKMSKRQVSLCLYLDTRTHTITWALFESLDWWWTNKCEIQDYIKSHRPCPVAVSVFFTIHRGTSCKCWCPDTDLKTPHNKAMQILKLYYSLGSNVTAAPSGTILVNAHWGTHLCILGGGLMTIWLSTDVTPADWKLAQFPMRSRGIIVLVLLTYPF